MWKLQLDTTKQCWALPLPLVKKAATACHKIVWLLPCPMLEKAAPRPHKQNGFVKSPRLVLPSSPFAKAATGPHKVVLSGV